MGDNFNFGGGIGSSSMHPAVLLATVLAAACVLFLPRKHIYAPIAVITLLVPFGEQIYAVGFHFFALRIVILVGAVRMLLNRPSTGGSAKPNGHASIEKLFCWWAFFRAVTFILLYREGGAVANQLGFWICHPNARRHFPSGKGLGSCRRNLSRRNDVRISDTRQPVQPHRNASSVVDPRRQDASTGRIRKFDYGRQSRSYASSCVFRVVEVYEG
jgi:hypothetical protein